MRVLICGDRNWNRREPMEHFFSLTLTVADVVIEGEARGADSMARDIARERGIGVDAYPANWQKYGRGAGPIRNKQMLEEGKPDFVVAFHSDFENSRGTKNMIEQARKAGIPCFVVSA